MIRAFWLESGSGALACWLHEPSPAGARSYVAIICPPVGFEYAHSHRSLRHLAISLSGAGFRTVRFDYRGTGDSSGDATDPALFEQWLEDVRAVTRWAKGPDESREVAIVGLRLGASLAALVSEAVAATHLVLWAPVVDGSRYARTMRAAAAVAASGEEKPRAAYIDSGGVVVSAETLRHIQQLDLRSAPIPAGTDVLLVRREDVPTDVSWPRSLTARGLSIEELNPGGFAAMMAEPQDTVVPAGAIRGIVAWLSDRASPPGSLSIGRGETAPGGESERTHCWGAGGSVRERFVHVGGSPRLFGCLTEPTRDTTDGRPLVLLINAGAVHHVGPNRLYTELARALALGGYPSLRIDLRNVGESFVLGGPEENHPYPVTAQDDVGAAVQWVLDELRLPVVIAGLCSGAHHAFHAGFGHLDARVVGIVLMNPLTFYWSEGMSLDTPNTAARDARHYRRSMRDPKKWLKALRGGADLRYAASVMGRRGLERARAMIGDALELSGLRRPRHLAEDLRRIVALDRRVACFFSRGDPGYDILQQDGGRTLRSLRRSGALSVDLVDGADHTFSKRAHREEVIEQVLSRLATWGRATP